MDQSPWETNNISDNTEIQHIIQNTKVHYYVDIIPPVALSWARWIQSTHTFYFCYYGQNLSVHFVGIFGIYEIPEIRCLILDFYNWNLTFIFVFSFHQELINLKCN